MHDLNEPTANKIINHLHLVSIETKKLQQADGQWTIMVGEKDYLPAIREIEAARLIRPVIDKQARKTSLISSREEQRFSLERALSEEIERTLEILDHVLEARVHLHLPPLGSLFEQANKSFEASGSVLLIANEENRVSLDEVRHLVAGAAGIRPDQVKVLIRRNFAPLPQGRASAPSHPKDPERRLAAEPAAFGVFAWWDYLPGAACVVLGGVLILIGLRSRRRRHWRQIS